MSVVVEQAPQPRAGQLRLEMCEHKGHGHPDSLTDGACEAAAVALARSYRQAFGVPMHYNVDKGLLMAGRSAPRFGGGELLEPARLVICGRAADPQGRFDLRDVAAQAARSHLGRTLRRGADNFRIGCEIRHGSPNLQAAYAGGAPLANDTSFGVGFWPYSALERAVLEAAALLRSEELPARFPQAGDDFKVMGLRRDADDAGLYLTVTGLSAEMGDDGQVGRGNRVNGLITPGRPMSLEAAAGKNALAHVGKIYNVLANRIARAVCEEVPEVLEASVQLVSQIGRPIAEPWAASVQVSTSSTLTNPVRRHVHGVIAQLLQRTAELTRRLEVEGLA
jgi:S-adenosylmethionine synthetase